MSNLLERAGVWDFCYGRGEPFGRLTPEQEQRLRERYLPEVEALEELLEASISPAWKKAASASSDGCLADDANLLTHAKRSCDCPISSASARAGPAPPGCTKSSRAASICRRGIKETDFFTTNYAKGIEWYAHHFRDADRVPPDRRGQSILRLSRGRRAHRDSYSAMQNHLHVSQSGRANLLRLQTLASLHADQRSARGVPRKSSAGDRSEPLRHASARLPRAFRRRPRAGPAQRRPARRSAGLPRPRLRFHRHRALPGAAAAAEGELINSINDLPRFPRRCPQGAQVHVLARGEAGSTAPATFSSRRARGR